MRLARSFVTAFAALAVMGCGAPQSSADAPSCAKTFVIAITSSEATPGVWDCLTDGYHNRLQGEGDAVFALTTPLWTQYRYIGQDRNIAMFDLKVNGRVEPSVYNPPVTHVIMAVYLDASGRVDHAKAATPT